MIDPEAIGEGAEAADLLAHGELAGTTRAIASSSSVPNWCLQARRSCADDATRGCGNRAASG